ncbi:unnamed protein product [Vitrella brassicaformis CCMP3155]|uniref:Uncharacterized protein n=1 Tax=Vitrella brassicaformis (strain CCMP3155) TaxID=1169540 RepID=A0A0G4FNK3_VITBC|nr:unnamed protein product [Vitrella brassicaformis CCMP3155]|eukprot:CEM15627.1 unnamed protein product [Vitrella brassicaformis CCMP3155]
MAVSHDDPTTRRAALTQRILAQQTADLPADGQKMAGMETAIKQLVMQSGVSSTSLTLDDIIKVGVAAAVSGYDMAMRATAEILPEAVADVQETTADSMRSLDDAVTHLGHKHDQLLGGVTHAVANLTKVAIHQDSRLDAISGRRFKGGFASRTLLANATPSLPPFDTRSFACFAVGSRSRDVIIHFHDGDLSSALHARMESGHGLQLFNGPTYPLLSERTAGDHLKYGLRLAERTQKADDIYVGPALAVPSAEALSPPHPTYDLHLLTPLALPRVSARDFTEAVHQLNDAVDPLPPSIPDARPSSPPPNQRKRHRASPARPALSTHPRPASQVPLMLPAPSTPAGAGPSMHTRPPSVPTRPSRPRAPPMPAMSPASASMPSGGYMAPPPAPVPYATYIQPLSSCAPPAPQPGPYAPHPQLFPSSASPAPHPANASHPMLAPITEELTEEQLDELNREGEIFSRSASSRSLASMRTATSLPGPYPPHKPGVMSTWAGLNAPGVPRFRHQR